MALKSKDAGDFGLRFKDTRAHGENTVFVKGGSTIVGERWVFFNDLRIDIKEIVLKYINTASRRIFNNFNDILYVLIVRTNTGKVEVIPSVSFNKKSFGNVKVFPDLVDKMPLVLVKLQHDGSAGLTGIKNITQDDVELYKGYGNFTLKGPKGPEGYKGITGLQGITGYQGLTGHVGITGMTGYTGIIGYQVTGETGVDGLDGDSEYRYLPERYDTDLW